MQPNQFMTKTIKTWKKSAFQQIQIKQLKRSKTWQKKRRKK